MEGALRVLRNANDERPGREFYMAEMGMEILGKPDASISYFGSGLNSDHRWIQRKYPEVTTKLVDLENMQELDCFEAIADATPSDVVVACEVIEHFGEPVEHFKSLLRLLKDKGILICSTNIYDGSDVSCHQYPFHPGHVAYWSPLSLIKMATDQGCFVDFRTPNVAYGRGGPRKRFVIFFRDTEVLFRTSLFFGTHMHAPSET
jgi:SAM-dependent methyltransferase